MTTKKTTLTGYLFKWFIAMTLFIVAATFAVHFKPYVFQHESLDSPREHIRTITPAQLIANIDERVELEQAHCAALEQSIAKARESFGRLGAPIQFTTAEVDERRRELIRYADFVNANEGVVLENGDFVSSDELRQRATRRRNELAAMTKQIVDANDFESKTTGTIRQLETMLAQRKRGMAELDLLRTNLVEKVNLLASMSTSSDNGSEQPSVSSLREAVARMQDVIEVRLEMAVEDSPAATNLQYVLSE